MFESPIVLDPQANRATPRDYLRAARPHQWAKNLLIFVPVATSHRLEAAVLANTLLATLCFCLAASGAYILNDLLDLAADRAHPVKRHRPFAAGLIPASHGWSLAAALLTVAGATSLRLPGGVAAVLAVYVAATLAYSLRFKREMVIDVVILSGLYVVRVVAGTYAAGTARSPWLLMFCMFLFLSLALVKRCSELVMVRDRGGTQVGGRGYRVADLPAITALAAAAGYGAAMVFALYLSSPEMARLYRTPELLWAACPILLAWISRVILLSTRGELHHDPVVFALTDRVSLLTGLAFAAVVVVAI
ncbi:UbiA family prenyltransferase [Sphingomonas sp.]|uniref:UbiA family prenyltransferase n=1 Tax=Sphingomonas sp. TaxID=28214 RepID=UPI003AFFBB11